MDDGSERRKSFILFVGGALLYAAAAALCVAGRIEGGGHLLELLTPLFGLPYLLARRRGGWALAAYFILLLPAFHFAAIQVAIKTQSWPEGSLFLAGMAGGLVGAILSFAALRVLRLNRPGPALGTILAAIVILVFLGGVGVWQMNFLKDPALRDYGLLLSLYLPWQIAFGFFLAKLLGPVPAPGEPRS